MAQIFNKYHFRQFAATVTMASCLISAGMHLGWQSPATERLLNGTNGTKIIPDYNETYDIVLQVIFLVGGVAFCPLIVLSCEYIGRKWTNVVSSAINLAAWIIIAIANRSWQLVIAKILGGIAYCADSITIAIYITEIADKKIRGFFLGYMMVNAMIGIIIIYAIFPYMAIWASSLVGITIHSIHLVVYTTFMPQSPHFLYQLGKVEDTKKALSFFRPEDEVEELIREISWITRRSRVGKFTDLWNDYASRKALIIGGFQQFMLPISGLSMITMNLHELLPAERVLLPKNTTAIMFAVCLAVAQIIGMTIVDYFGRKPMLLFSLIACNICLLIYTIYSTVNTQNPNLDYSSASWIPEIILLLYAITYRLALGSVPGTLCAEMFPIPTKPIGVTVCFVIMTVIDALVTLLYDVFVDFWPGFYTFYIFIAISATNIPFIIFLVPETKGKDMVEVEEMMEDRNWLRVGRKKKAADEGDKSDKGDKGEAGAKKE